MHAHFSAFTTLLQWLGPAPGEGWCRPSPLPISAQQPVKRKGFVLVGAGVWLSCLSLFVFNISPAHLSGRDKVVLAKAAREITWKATHRQAVVWNKEAYKLKAAVRAFSLLVAALLALCKPAHGTQQRAEVQPSSPTPGVFCPLLRSHVKGIPKGDTGSLSYVPSCSLAAGPRWEQQLRPWHQSRPWPERLAQGASTERAGRLQMGRMEMGWQFGT